MTLPLFCSPFVVGRTRTRSLACERLEDGGDTAVVFRTIDGTGNNLLHPEWGSTGEQLLRVAPAEYRGCPPQSSENEFRRSEFFLTRQRSSRKLNATRRKVHGESPSPSYLPARR